MPGRSTPLVAGEYYHVYNRGSDKRVIFNQSRDYKRLQLTFYYYQYIGPKPRFSRFSKSDLRLFKPDIKNKLIEVVCYCLMPNHFHFLVKQLKDNGISIFMSQLSNSYTKYFNTKYPRVGPLLQGKFQAVLIETDEQLIHTSRYIHLNPIVSKVTSDLNNYPWSSYSEYLTDQERFCVTGKILDFFPSIKKYQEFVEAQIDYGTSLEILKHKAIDYDD